MAKAKKIEVEESLEKKLWKAADKLHKNKDAAESISISPWVCYF
jgi:hypothetical protein